MSARACFTAPQRYDWSTPQRFFDRLAREFSFTLDVAASERTAKCDRYFTPEDDGLAQSWRGEVCWMNPPYGREIAKWMRKAIEEAQDGATVVCLIPARTDTAWWHDYALLGEIRFVRGRIRFGRPLARNHDAPFPCAVVVFHPGLRHQSEHLTMEAA